MPSIRCVDRESFFGVETICYRCRHGTADQCPYLAARDPLAGLDAAGAEAICCQATYNGGPVDTYKVTYCPRFEAGPLPPVEWRD